MAQSNVLSDERAGADPPSHLLRNLILFARLLRVGGLDVTPQRITDWLRALELIDINARDDVRDLSRTLLVRRVEDIPWFDAAFDLFWQARDPEELAELEMGLLLQRQDSKIQQASRGGRVDTTRQLPQRPDERAETSQEVPEWSDAERLRRKDFAELRGAELAEVEQLIGQLRFDLQTRRSRRAVAARHGQSLDLRRSVRASLRTGGELVTLLRRRRKLKQRPLVVLCDVSGSMEPYSRLLLRFLYVITRARTLRSGAVETFAFGTRLTRLTRELRERNVDRALGRASRRIEDWGGGTRTGEALHTFNLRWHQRVLGHGAVVLIISDGWDRGDIELLGREMQRLHRSCHRLIWLNPLLGSPSYQPLTRGMQAALPYVDDFLPVHNLLSLEQLGRALASIG